MSKESNNSGSGGIGFFGLLTILFIGLKLTGYIEWSWIWVLSPLWMPIVFVVAFVAMIGVGLMTIPTIESVIEKKKKK
jgi:hypothetical protein